MGFNIKTGQKVELRYGSAEPEAVKIAVRNLAQDLRKVLSEVEVVFRETTAEGTKESARELSAEEAEDGKEFKESESGGTNQQEICDGAREQEISVIIIKTLLQQGSAAENAAKQGNTGENGTIAAKQPAAGKSRIEPEEIEQVIDRSLMTDEAGLFRKEAYQLRVQDKTLYIAGTDRRGTIYGIYTFCQWMGVSPWYFFADVPVKKKQELALEEGYCRTDWPSVEYRGIFINDEEELEVWVRNYMGEPTIGVKSYEKIFELLLRLKANYIWPAMHVNSFNLTPENGALADRMGIVVGTSHCDMLMRSNNREWKPWIQKKGYTDAAYDYSIEGRNRDILKEYWRESVEQNRDFEVCYTLGMRGIHDSGFETKHLDGRTEEEIRNAKISLLEQIITDQREILGDTLGHETMMTFIPYKEVLELYDNGLKIPEDMTLVWANDNYGYIRRYPSEQEKERKGGNGIYYHNSYWAPPSMSYVFLCSIPLAHTRNELQKAWDEGIRKLWVLNSGAMKPLEQEITFFLKLAWEIGKPGALTEDVEAFVEDWIDGSFTGKIGRQVSDLLNDFSQLTNVRKLENMDYDAFSQTAYGDEAAIRIHRYEELFAQGNALYEKLPEEEKDAFFQLVLMRIHAAYFTNLSYYYGDRSTLMYDRGNQQGARHYTEKSREAEDARRRLLHYYNHVMCGGKWNGILNPEGFPPPRAAMMPVCTPPLEWCGGCSVEAESGSLEESDSGCIRESCIGSSAESAGGCTMESGIGSLAESANGCTAEPGSGSTEKSDNVCTMEACNCSSEGSACRYTTESDSKVLKDKNAWEVYLWNEEEEICFATPGEKWLEIGNLGTGEFEVSLCAPRWITLSEERAVIRSEKRISVTVAETAENREGEIVIENLCDGTAKRIPVRILATDLGKDGNGEDNRFAACCAYEEDGLVVLEAAQVYSGLESSGDFKNIPRLGRMQGSLVEARVKREPVNGTQETTKREGIPLRYHFVTRSKGDFLLEIHRFPSLNSVGRIRIGLSLDDGPVQIAESFSNDEWKGNWKKNVLNNVDRLYVTLPAAAPGRHELSLWAVDPYFAFSRMVIYTAPRKENALAGIKGAQPLPLEREIHKWCDSFYGKYELPPRPVFYAVYENSEDTLSVTCREVQADHYGKEVKPDWYRQRGNRVFEENRGAVKIDAAAALAQSRYAWTQEPEGRSALWGQKNGLWRHCAGESFGRSGLALYIRTPELSWQVQEAPSLNYRFVCQGGGYTLWILTKFNLREEGVLAAGFDDKIIPKEQLCRNGSLWRYEAEQIYRWIPLAQAELASGEHVLHIYALASGMRYDRIYLTKGEVLPPMDTEW